MHVLNPGPTGGLERVVELLASGRARQGQPTAAVLTCFSDGDGLDMEATLGAGGVEVWRMVVGLRDYRGERRRVAELAQEWGAEVLHSHGYRSDLVTLSLTRATGCLTVSTAHGFTGGGWRNRQYERLQSWAWRHFDAVAAVSEPLRRGLLERGVAEGKVTVVRNAWAGEETTIGREEARRQLGISDDGVWLGWVGRLSAEKGPDLMIQALAEVPDARLLMVGDGRERASLELLAASLGVSGRVRFAGLVKDSQRLMKAFDRLVISSRTEGTPMVLFEAIAAGVPVVATRVGGIPDVVSEREAYLAEPDAGQLARQIRLALGDGGEAERRAVAAKERLERTANGEAWLENYEQLYRRCREDRRLTPQCR